MHLNYYKFVQNCLLLQTEVNNNLSVDEYINKLNYKECLSEQNKQKQLSKKIIKEINELPKKFLRRKRKVCF